ncbi:MAG: dioxygenase [Actinobacteria bacterium]|nr:dioxygenase [Actinomycetota bacterium]
MSRAAAAFDAFEPEALARSGEQTVWQPGDDPLPSIYLSHGAPPLFEDAGWIDELFAWSTSMPKPRGIVIISAHWEAAPILITAPNPATGVVYDFGGFDPRYYSMQYATPDAAALGAQVSTLLSDLSPVRDTPRGLDHGAWVPLKVMYPLADVPVVQVSLPTDRADVLLQMGARLRALREEGVLVIGSGFMTHGLPFLTREMVEGKVPGWSSDFDAWAWEALQAADLETLADFRHLAPGMPYSHPTVEHFTPLFVTLGAASDLSSVRTVIDGAMWGLSRRSLELV